MLIYPWLVQKNYTLRWRRLLLYGRQSYRSIVLIFAWLFQARPLYIVVLLAGVWAISKLALTTSMKQQLDPMEILRELRQGGIAMNTPIPHLILLCLCNLLTRAQSWRMLISGLTINLWWRNFHLPENYCKALSPILIIILGWECSWFDLAVLTYGEAMKPTFGKRAKLPVVSPIVHEEWLQDYLSTLLLATESW